MILISTQLLLADADAAVQKRFAVLHLSNCSLIFFNVRGSGADSLGFSQCVSKCMCVRELVCLYVRETVSVRVR